MPKLPKFTLKHNDKKDRWDLVKDKTNRTVKTFETKDEATMRGILKQAVGKDGGSVKIQKEDGEYQEERTYPKGADPIKSKG